MEITMKFNYQQAIESIYTDARWEDYYDPVIIPFFNICCYNTGVKIVPVHATRKSGRKPFLSKKHFIDTYSIMRRGYCKKYTDYICVDAIGELIKPNYVTDHFKVVLKEHGLKPVRFHDLRHSCASLLLANVCR